MGNVLIFILSFREPIYYFRQDYATNAKISRCLYFKKNFLKMQEESDLIGITNFERTLFFCRCSKIPLRVEALDNFSPKGEHISAEKRLNLASF